MTLHHLAALPSSLPGFTLTLLYHAFTPVSVALSAVLPLYFAWVAWDAWWRSPVFLATLLLAPLKWVPWAAPCWLWPGVL